MHRDSNGSRGVEPPPLPEPPHFNHWIVRKLLDHFSQNFVERWNVGHGRNGLSGSQYIPGNVE